MDRRIYIFFTIFFVFALSLKADITISGSDLSEKAFSKIAAEYEKATGEKIILSMHGSSKGNRDLHSDKSDLAILAIPQGKSVPSDAMLLSAQAAIVLVYNANPLEKISSEQLRRIYAKTRSDQIKFWYELGIENTREIQAGVYRNDDTVADQLFQHIIFPDAEYQTNIRIFQDREKLIDYVKQNINGIAVTDRLPTASESIRILPIFDPQTNKSYFPTEENIEAKLYPYQLPFYIVYNKDKESKISPFLQFLFSDECINILKKEGFITLPQSKLQEYRFLLRSKNN